ncbi:MAG: phosphatidate cytidylyltransferase, partial [Magnetococcales bacterium]|nr:phosphatidate cytidylyltransferase [Magnetococcales bacterium]
MLWQRILSALALIPLALWAVLREGPLALGALLIPVWLGMIWEWAAFRPPVERGMLAAAAL